MASALTPLDTSELGDEARELKTNLQKLVIGQDGAVAEIANTYQMYLAGLHAPGRPVGSFLFLGPTGTGKTRTVEATAEALVHNSRAVVKIDCGEYQHGHEIAKLVGAPPGYIGHSGDFKTPPLLSQQNLDRHHTEKVKLSFLLFDEIEKANASLRNLLLGVLDKATLSTGDNSKVDFSQSMVFMTSNLGTREMNDVLRPKRMGFSPVVQENETSDFEAQAAILTKTAKEALRREFTPEFINRLDQIITFQPLGQAQLKDILDIELVNVQNQIFAAREKNPQAPAFLITFTAPAKDHILAEGTDLVYGARPLKRALQRLVVQPLANLITSKQIRDGDLIRIHYNSAPSGALLFQRAEGEQAPACLLPRGVLKRPAMPGSYPEKLLTASC